MKGWVPFDYDKYADEAYYGAANEEMYERAKLFTNGLMDYLGIPGNVESFSYDYDWYDNLWSIYDDDTLFEKVKVILLENLYQEGMHSNKELRAIDKSVSDLTFHEGRIRRFDPDTLEMIDD